MSYSQRVARDFSKAAENYDDFAELQRRVVDGLLPWVPAHLSKVLDAGAGTGYAKQEGWIALDVAQGMCRLNEGSICADMQMIPLTNSSLEAVFSSLAVQWISDVPAFLQEAHRCVQADGCLVIATLGAKTLQSLRESFTRAGMEPPLLPFQVLETLEVQLQEAGWKIEREEVQMLETVQDNVRSLLLNLKGLGARDKVKKLKVLRGKGWLKALEENYPSKLNNRIKIEWEVINIKANKV